MVTMEFAYKLAASLRDDNEMLLQKLKECEKKVVVLEKQINNKQSNQLKIKIWTQ